MLLLLCIPILLVAYRAAAIPGQHSGSRTAS